VIRFSTIKRLPTTPLLALAALALAFVAAGGGATPADAQTLEPRYYTIELSFDTIMFPAIDDCEWGIDFCNWAELYGTLNGRTTNAGVGENGARNIGTWGNTAGCRANWAGSQGSCLAEATTSYAYSFAERLMCASYTHTLCTGNYLKNNNKIRLTVKPGEQIRAGIHLYDYDKLSGDDDACAVTRWVGPFTATELSTLNKTGLGMGMAFNGSASCTVTFSLKRVS